MLDRSKAQSILLIAPAGYGKTSLAAEWLEGRSDVGWYRCTPGSADVAAFSVGVAERLAWIAPGAADRLRQRLTVPDSPEAVARPLADMLAEELTPWPDGAWLVVDDYHLAMKSTAVEEFVELLLEFCPLRLLVTSRRRPRWATARRILEGNIEHVATRFLAMNASEAGLLLEGCASDAVRALVSQARGWPAVLALASFTSVESWPVSRVQDELFRYFAEEIVRGEPGDIQQFMLGAAVPRFVPHPDHAHSSRNDIEAFNHLSEIGILQPRSEDGVEFHPLLRNYLRQQLHKQHPDRAGALLDQAIDQAVSRRQWPDAFELAIEDGRVDRAMAVTASAASDMLASGQAEILESWIGRCEALAPPTPRLKLIKAELAFRSGTLPLARALAIEVAEADDLLRSSAYELAGRASRLMSEDTVALEFYANAEALALKPEERLAATWGAFCLAIDTGQHADPWLDRLRGLETADQPKTRARIGMARFMSRMHSGHVNSALTALDELRPTIADVGDPLIVSAWIVQRVHALNLASRYQEALNEAIALSEYCDRFRLKFAQPLANLLRCHALIGIGDNHGAHRALSAALSTRGGLDPYHDCLAASCRIRLALLTRRFDRAASQCSGSGPLGVAEYAKGELLALEALVLGLVGQTDQAVHRIHQVSGEERDYHGTCLSKLVRFLILTGQDDAGTRAEAQAVVGDALQRGMRDPVVTVLRARPQALRTLARGEVLPAMVERLLVDTNDVLLAEEAGLRVLFQADASPALASLTTRETEVLRLIAAGYSNREIADHLVIAESTAKVHVRNVLRKLGVRSRLQAALTFSAARDHHAASSNSG
jgi:ATP/maltotriose-dependent transcriptional regulator MalT